MRALDDPHAGPPDGLLARWSARPDGAAVPGWMGRVWPVVGPAGERWVVKVTDAHHPPTAEGTALRAWAVASARARSRVVRLVDEHDGALLLERLGHTHLSRVPDIDEADAVLADCLSDLAHVPAPPGLSQLADELDRIAASVTEHRGDAPEEVSARRVERALDTLVQARADLARLPTGRHELLHFDLHYDNVLEGPPGSGRKWVVIDPLPHSGTREVEVVAALRNRFADAVASGDPDGHLRRRLDRLAEAGGLDRDLAQALTQAVAVDNVLWLAHRVPDHFLLPAYRVLSHW